MYLKKKQPIERCRYEKKYLKSIKAISCYMSFITFIKKKNARENNRICT